ncbi:hypothetical protein BDP27DRAFT_422330 [Rhodocollybia butyracea]|uniref:Uncharacterized protein n=1 Tax=Rhodocollybia butyracea TaxID=206335 RepID=A0A9P5TZ26_9AGAR|nr:hypothetical protein BDP27DRAFT_422330 [Rhodocollybia butyracea]
MSSKFSDVFPPTLPPKSPPPFRNDVQQGFRTPQYLLGWGDPISHVASWTLSARWPEVRSKYPALECVFRLLLSPSSHIITRALTAPASLTWDYPYVIVYICSNNFPNKMKLVLEHEDEAIRAAMEVIGFPSEREAELKWYRSSKQK